MRKDRIYIYALINPITNHVFYVGASATPYHRREGHILESRQGWTDSYKCIQIRSIEDANEEVEILILEECELSKASFWEKWYMDLFISFGFKLQQLDYSTYTANYTVVLGLKFRSVQIKGYQMAHTLTNTNKYGIVDYSDTIKTPMYSYNEGEIKDFMYKEAAEKGFKLKN